MRDRINDGLRSLIGVLAAKWGALLSIRQWFAMVTFRTRHNRLRRRLGIEPGTPISTYGADTAARIAEAAARLPGPVTFALTSGSSAEPKRILYTAARVRAVKRVYIDVFCRMFHAMPLRRRGLFVMAGGGEDESLTSHLLAERGRVGALALLQAPYRALSVPDVKALVASHGLTAVRLLLLAQANPGVLYATNPSTLSTFFDEVAASWTKSASLVREYHQRPQGFTPEVRRILTALASRGAQRRLAAIADAAGSDHALPVTAWLPGLEAYVCWTGGYVAPFLERLEAHLPPARYRRVAMYALSTEAVETVTCFRTRGGAADPAFVPLGPGTLYELLDVADPDDVTRLLAPWQARPGGSYTMVVSDAFGLQRYQTGDVFRCERLLGDLPDLRFLRRRALEHSFTGEKVTAEQLTLVFTRLRASSLANPNAVVFLTCIPSHPNDEPIPHYRLIVVGTPAAAEDLSTDALADAADAALQSINIEYRDKRRSGRLRPMRGVRMDRETFLGLVGGTRHGQDWESQFKFLPLYTRTWEAFTADTNV